LESERLPIDRCNDHCEERGLKRSAGVKFADLASPARVRSYRRRLQRSNAILKRAARY
jgi:hypothetical protein